MPQITPVMRHSTSLDIFRFLEELQRYPQVKYAELVLVNTEDRYRYDANLPNFRTIFRGNLGSLTNDSGHDYRFEVIVSQTLSQFQSGQADVWITLELCGLPLGRLNPPAIESYVSKFNRVHTSDGDPIWRFEASFELGQPAYKLNISTSSLLQITKLVSSFLSLIEEAELVHRILSQAHHGIEAIENNLFVSA